MCRRRSAATQWIGSPRAGFLEEVTAGGYPIALACALKT